MFVGSVRCFFEIYETGYFVRETLIPLSSCRIFTTKKREEGPEGSRQCLLPRLVSLLVWFHWEMSLLEFVGHDTNKKTSEATTTRNTTETFTSETQENSNEDSDDSVTLASLCSSRNSKWCLFPFPYFTRDMSSLLSCHNWQWIEKRGRCFTRCVCLLSWVARTLELSWSTREQEFEGLKNTRIPINPSREGRKRMKESREYSWRELFYSRRRYFKVFLLVSWLFLFLYSWKRREMKCMKGRQREVGNWR
jgi:hypothetical protein